MLCHHKSISHFHHNQVGECCTMINLSCYNFSNLEDNNLPQFLHLAVWHGMTTRGNQVKIGQMRILNFHVQDGTVNEIIHARE